MLVFPRFFKHFRIVHNCSSGLPEFPPVHFVSVFTIKKQLFGAAKVDDQPPSFTTFPPWDALGTENGPKASPKRSQNSPDVTFP